MVSPSTHAPAAVLGGIFIRLTLTNTGRVGGHFAAIAQASFERALGISRTRVRDAAAPLDSLDHLFYTIHVGEHLSYTWPMISDPTHERNIP